MRWKGQIEQSVEAPGRLETKPDAKRGLKSFTYRTANAASNFAHILQVFCIIHQRLKCEKNTRKKAIGNESAPIQLAQCRSPGLAIFNAKMSIYFLNKIYGSNFIKQHSETVMV